MPARIPLDPILPDNFDNTPNEDRSAAELDAWWDKPFGVTMDDGKIDVRCLNGGAWDRPTYWGVADDYEAACALAEQQMTRWNEYRSRPVLRGSADRFFAVIVSLRPGVPEQVLEEFGSIEEASAWMHKNYPG
ncbi:DNA-binding protein [Paraburkholderia sp. C35]|uniref:DNA-binding protein n=1 Tax=Paraburkholderia sp. C35 TaxID=2126993 RepID=UPI000D69572E|nr:DNA-binding protein [Paraburkholderia sp. C35]